MLTFLSSPSPKTASITLPELPVLSVLFVPSLLFVFSEPFVLSELFVFSVSPPLSSESALAFDEAVPESADLEPAPGPDAVPAPVVYGEL